MGDEVEVDLPNSSKQRRKRRRSFPGKRGRSPMPALYLLGKSDDRTWDPCRNRAEKGQGKSKRIEPRPLSLFSLSLFLFFILFFYSLTHFCIVLITMNYFFDFGFPFEKSASQGADWPKSFFFTNDAAYEKKKRLVFAIQLITFPIPWYSTQERPPTLSVKYN